MSGAPLVVESSLENCDVEIPRDHKLLLDENPGKVTSIEDKGSELQQQFDSMPEGFFYVFPNHFVSRVGLVLKAFCHNGNGPDLDDFKSETKLKYHALDLKMGLNRAIHDALKQN